MKQSPQLLVAIDVGASALVVALACAGQTARVQDFPNTAAGHRRLIQTLTREWAYARSYDSSAERAAFLNPFLHDDNFHRPHSALQHLPPASRLPKSADNLLINDS